MLVDGDQIGDKGGVANSIEGEPSTFAVGMRPPRDVKQRGSRRATETTVWDSNQRPLVKLRRSRALAGHAT